MSPLPPGPEDGKSSACRGRATQSENSADNNARNPRPTGAAHRDRPSHKASLRYRDVTPWRITGSGFEGNDNGLGGRISGFQRNGLAQVFSVKETTASI
ncbi:hypothetical protein LX36DRAFT_660452 [Colletotrichum falcatum]|nr:hypothetical protein LX36DRAFT_660452 [Colletotrichum falcatum]